MRPNRPLRLTSGPSRDTLHLSDGPILLRRHIILLNEALHAAAGCILLSFAAGLLMKAVVTTCLNIRLSDGRYLTIHDFGVPWNYVSYHGRSLLGMVL